MDDDLLLNIDNNLNSRVLRKPAKKGGRWSDRLKTNRTAKRKFTNDAQLKDGKTNDKQSLTADNINLRPLKRQRRETQSTAKDLEYSKKNEQRSYSKHVISSLFTSNPAVDIPSNGKEVKSFLEPSNAPLRDRSSFIGLGVDPLIVAHLEKLQILSPTTIQKETLPVLLHTPSDEGTERDVFISSQTGSGKTISFLIPIIQDLLPLSTLSYIDRSIGTLAIIIAPTRELAKQISDVLETLLTLRLRPSSESMNEENSSHLTRWLVSGLLIGGATRSHEKARLRKGLPILVSTPGRLLDHLQNTSSFNVGKCRWLILDEADRLMELGFEDTLKSILQALDGRRKLALLAREEGKGAEVSVWDWTKRRRTVLCSATMREDVQNLAGTVLIRPIIVKEKALKQSEGSTFDISSNTIFDVNAAEQQKFALPSQLLQRCIVVPLKLRLVTLIALLRLLLSQSQGARGTNIIVFFSCTDSVDYHWALLGDLFSKDKVSVADVENEEQQLGEDNKHPQSAGPHMRRSSFLSGTSIYRLHGSLPLATRLASLKQFSSTETSRDATTPSSSILFCTSVASRGLDLPLVGAVIQYDLPTEGGVNEYIHRAGRTARAGKGGEAWSFVAPSENFWIEWINEKLRANDENAHKSFIQNTSFDEILRSGFGGSGSEYEERATEVQMTLERLTVQKLRIGDLAQKAFRSHIRAYATHPFEEKHIFHVRHLHLGHLAKSFALRDAPSDVSGKQQKALRDKKKISKRKFNGRGKGSFDDRDILERKGGITENRMREVVRSRGKLTKKGGVMVTSGLNDFQVASSEELQRLLTNR